MHMFGLAVLLFGNNGGIYVMSNINVLACFQEDYLTCSVDTDVDMYECICWMGRVWILWY